MQSFSNKELSTVGKFSDYKLPLKSLAPGVHEMNFHMGKQFFVNMENQDIHDADLNAQLTVKNQNGIYDLTFHITGDVVVLCDRCLDDLHFPIDTDYHIFVKYGDKFNDDGDELLEIPESDNYLNIAYMLYDTVALAIPIKHVHPLGKCNRQMSALLKKHRAENGEDSEDIDMLGEMDFDSDSDSDNSPSPKNTDPRWDALKNLSTND